MEDLRGITLRLPELRLRAEQYYHHGSFCLFAKYHNRNVACAANKEKSKQRANRQSKPFWGCCPYGVWDLAMPVRWREETIAIFYLGSFIGDRPLKAVRGHSYQGPPLPPITVGQRRELLRYGRMLADYLSLQIEVSNEREALFTGLHTADFYRDATHQFIASHYHEPVNLQSYAEQLRLHPNYLGQQVVAACGRRFSELLRDYRLERAQILLRSSRHSITRIAFECGFQDANYFSTIFRRQAGQSPRRYRNDYVKSKGSFGQP